MGTRASAGVCIIHVSLCIFGGVQGELELEAMYMKTLYVIEHGKAGVLKSPIPVCYHDEVITIAL